MAEQGTASGRNVFRTPGSVVLWWAWLVAAVIILASVAARGHNHAGVVTVLVVLTITGCMYACALQPRIVADAGGITVQNPLRWHVLPWAVVTKVDLAQTVQVHHTGTPGGAREKTVHSWAVQSSAASRTRAELRARHNARTAARTAPRTAAGYGQSAGAAAARQPPAAQFIARQLDERVTAEHQRAADQAAADQAAADQAAADQAAAEQAAAGQRAAVRWAWWPIAAIVAPLLALVIVAVT
ncbi:MAG TPA: PH domain-containing protein [Streptosporangiaceae bacterium]|nr:PH domain-containing protein [Streptosporangiaceae bacterium]